MEIIEGNKLIAVFNGYIDFPDEMGLKMEYNSRWDNLMPVVEKLSRIEFDRHEVDLPFGGTETIIETHSPRTFGMLNKENKPMFRFNCGMLHTADTLIEAAWLAVVDFIQWYNQQTDNPCKRN